MRNPNCLSCIFITLEPKTQLCTAAILFNTHKRNSSITPYNPSSILPFALSSWFELTCIMFCCLLYMFCVFCICFVFSVYVLCFLCYVCVFCKCFVFSVLCLCFLYDVLCFLCYVCVFSMMFCVFCLLCCNVDYSTLSSLLG
jgi:hypothetical protein